ncbi:MAG TPA: 4,5-DOPA dioxygenase extradiol [Polyangiales bacterium]|nr:4,5-DOPA dioxygenase extradiol [Polyangiales bacterium]
MPVLFVGHGSPMNAIEDNQWSRAFRALGEQLPRPRAVLCVSAHWYTPGTFLTDNLQPETIHDFGGFPPALHQMQYPAPGAPELAKHVSQLLEAHAARAAGTSVGPTTASLRSDWGLDHGTWSVLVHLLPAADVPVVQLSIDGRLPAAAHIELGKALSPLRDEGVLVLGSGNIVHNLRDAFGNMQRGITATPAWAAEFDRAAASAIEQRDAQHLASSLESSTGRNAHPTPEHYLPLLYAFGASSEGDSVSYPISGFDAGSLSMRAVRFG